jgi:putative methionine-R-sulfoxide reductase with GAF domain
MGTPHMRWFVEITSFGPDHAVPVTFCVEAPQWQPALQKTRALQGDDGPLSNFSIELLEDGYRAIDPVSRLRYMIQRAPDDAPLTGSEPPPPPPPPPVQARPARAATLVFSSRGVAAIREEPPKPVARPEPAAASPPVAHAPVSLASAQPPPTLPVPTSSVAAIALASARPADVSIAVAPGPAPPIRTPSVAYPPFELIGSRDENPSERSPLTYRERVYAVAEGTSNEAARDLLLDRFDDVRASLDQSTAGNLINLAVFDHVFRGKPQRRPIATLTWKDWKSAEPEIRYPLHETGGEPPSSREAPTRASAPPGSYPQPSVTPPSAPPPASAPASAPAGSISRKNPSERPPPPPARRLSGNELTLALSTAASDLRFLRDALAGAEFVLTLLREKLPHEIGLVSFFDSARREYVVVRQVGGPESILLKRMTEFAPIARAAMRNSHAVVVTDAPSDPRASSDDRWKAIGAPLKSFVTIPVQAGGRTLGLIDIANPTDGSRFSEADADGLTIVGERLGEFLSTREVILDPERVMKDAQKGARR